MSSADDSAVYMFFMCERWNDKRQKLVDVVRLVTPDKIIRLMFKVKIIGIRLPLTSRGFFQERRGSKNR